MALSASLAPAHAARRAGTRTGSALLLPAVLALGLTGCSATNELTTIGAYDASDGVSGTAGDVRAGNLVLVSAGEGEPGRLIGFLTNDAAQDTQASLSLAEGGAPVAVELGASETVQLGDMEGDGVLFESVPVIPGAMADVVLESPLGGSTTIPVPVLDGTLPEYADYVP